jgi:hypothetical protein
MPTYLVDPPPYQQRMGFMDALEDAGISYQREPDGYIIYLKDTQRDDWERVKAQFKARILEEDPPLVF